MVSALILVTAGSVCYWWFLSPGRLAAKATTVLAELTGAEVTAEGGWPVWPGGVVLKRVVVRVPGVEGEAGRLLQAERVAVRFDTAALWRGRIEPRLVELLGPTLHVCEFVDEDRFNFQMFPEVEGMGEGPAPTLPAIRITDGSLVSGEVDAGGYRRLGELRFDGRLSQDPADPEMLRLRLDEDPASTPTGAAAVRIAGRVSIDGLTAEGEVRGAAFAPRYRTLLPRIARDYWARMELEGQFTSVRFQTDPRRGWGVRVAFDSVGLTLPLPAIEDRAEPLRMTEVGGALRFEPERIEIEKPLVGRVAGLKYRVDGTIEGYREDAPFHVSVRTDAFDVPEAPQYIYALPRPVREGFEMLAPSGRLRVSLAVWRDARGGSIDYQGAATVLDGRGRYYQFPYELTNCRGMVRFDREQIRVLNLTGNTSGGGSATINGRIAPPGDTAAVDLTITAVDVPFDDVLRDALEPRNRPVIDMFFNEPAFKRLVERGHVLPFDRYNELEARASSLRRKLARLDPGDPPGAGVDERPGESPAQGDADARARVDALRAELAAVREQLDTPAFDLGGRADVVIHVIRPEGEGDLLEETTTVHLKQANVVFEHFPYPLMVDAGTLEIDDGVVKLSGIEADGVFGGRGELRGEVRIATDENPDAPLEPDVRVVATDLPLDAALIDALPAPQNQWLRDLRLSGEIDVAGRIMTDEQDQPDIDMRVRFTNATAKPGDELTLEDLDGEAALSLHDIEVKRLTGRFGDAELSIEGAADWRDGEQRRMDFTATLKGMAFDQPVFEVAEPFFQVDPQWKRSLERYAPRGRFDATLRYARAGADEPAMTLAVSPRELDLSYQERRVAIDEPTGRLIVRPDRVELDRLGGRVGGATFAIDGVVDMAEATRAELKLRVEGEALDDRAAAVLPEPLRRIIDETAFEGGYRLDLKPITFLPAAEGATPRLTARGTLWIEGGRFELGLPVRDFKGELELAASQAAGDDRPRLSIGVKGDQAVVAGRKVTDIHAVFTRPAEAEKPMVIENVRGRLYGGAVTADGSVDLDDRRFAVRFNLAEVDLRRFHQATEARRDDEPSEGAEGANEAGPDEGAPPDHGKAPENGEPEGRGEDRQPMKGRLSAAFNVQGKLNDLENVQARGKLRIDKAVLYDLPLSLGLLQVSHLSMPVARSFSRAQVDYHLKDGKFHFDRIALDSPALRMAGQGTLDPKADQLDLTLTSSNPSALKLGPLTEVIDGIRDQLVTVRITGTLDEPRTKVRQLNGLTEAWRDVFGRDDPASN